MYGEKGKGPLGPGIGLELWGSHCAFILACRLHCLFAVQMQHCYFGSLRGKQCLANKSITQPLCPQQQMADSWINSTPERCCSAVLLLGTADYETARSVHRAAQQASMKSPLKENRISFYQSVTPVAGATILTVTNREGVKPSDGFNMNSSDSCDLYHIMHAWYSSSEKDSTHKKKLFAEPRKKRNPEEQ